MLSAEIRFDPGFLRWLGSISETARYKIAGNLFFETGINGVKDVMLHLTEDEKLRLRTIAIRLGYGTDARIGGQVTRYRVNLDLDPNTLSQYRDMLSFENIIPEREYS